MKRPINSLRLECLEDRWTPAGGLDSLFDGDGRVSFNLASSDIANAVVVQPDGKIVLVGQNEASGSDFHVFRLLPNGQFDPTFSGDGKASMDFGSGSVDRATCVAVQPDGKIVVGGYTNVGGTNDFAIARFNADGSDDNTFHGNGRDWMPYNLGGSNDDRALGVAVQPDGKIVFVGSVQRNSTGDYDFAFMRFLANGDLDTTFSTDGMALVAFDVGGGLEDKATGVVVQPDGKIVVGGYAQSGPSDYSFAVTRLLTNGSIDSSFGTSGRTTVDFGGVDKSSALAQQPDGRIVATGVGGSSSNFCTLRLTTAGALDTTFDGDGRAMTDFGGEDVATALAIQPDGRIVVGGYRFSVLSGNNIEFVRYSASGNLDATFGSGGRASISPGTGTDERLFGLALQPDGNIVGVGYRNSDFVALRLNANPAAVVANFGNATWRWTSDLGWQQLSNEPASELDIAADGSVYGVYNSGVWRWAGSGGGAIQTTPGIPERIELTDGGLAYGDFGGNGAYAYTPASGWAQISTLNPSLIEASDDGSFFGYFSNGLWRWRADLGWTFLSGNAPLSMKVADGGVFIGVFGNGAWRWQNGAWTGLTGAVPQTYEVSDTGEFYGDFGIGDGGPDGIWRWTPATGNWTGVTGADPTLMRATGSGSIYANFGGGPTGIWRYDIAGPSWSQPHPTQIINGSAGIDGTFFADFGAVAPGIWRYVPGVGWTQLTTLVPTLMTSRR